MTIDDVNRLAALIDDDRETLLASWREQVRALPAASHLDVPTLNDHIPRLLDEVAAALREHSRETIAEALLEDGASSHGLQRLKDAFDVEEVVAEYNILRGCVHDLADTHGVRLQGTAFHIINRVFDTAIGIAVRTYAEQRAEEVQRRREEYLSFVAHDLRTPLNAISLAARMLEQGPSGLLSEAESTRMTNALRRSVEHLEGLVTKVLDENHHLEVTGTRLERRRLDLWPLVEGLIQDLHPVSGTSSTRLLNDVPDGLVVFADASLLRRIFQNLLANAIAYTPRGEVHITARVVPGGASVECLVSDNGTGIAPEQLPTLFDKGTTDPESDTGTGLGLAIVKTFTEAHGGTVTVESVVGEGSTFRIVLPGAPPKS